MDYRYHDSLHKTFDNVLSLLVMATSVKVHPGLSLVGIVISSSSWRSSWNYSCHAFDSTEGIFVYFEKYSGRQIVSPNGALLLYPVRMRQVPAFRI